MDVKSGSSAGLCVKRLQSGRRIWQSLYECCEITERLGSIKLARRSREYNRVLIL